MTTRLAIVVTIVNLAIAALSCVGQRAGAANDLGVLRGRGLQIVDDAGRIRASISVHPATADYPEIVLLRLVDRNGRPSVKLGASERNGGLTVCAATGTACAIFEPTGVRLMQ